MAASLTTGNSRLNGPHLNGPYEEEIALYHNCNFAEIMEGSVFWGES